LVPERAGTSVTRIAIVKTGDTLPELASRRGDFDDWIARGLGLALARLEVRRVDRGEPLPDPDSPAGVIVTGSSAMVTDREPWSERTRDWLGMVVQARVPVLGICYGHQLLAEALGGRVGDNPLGREIGTVEVRLLAAGRDDPLLAGLGHAFPAHATHVQSVLELPPDARHLARSAGDPHQAFAWGERAWGVQFHPEFDADVMRGYLDGRRDRIVAEGLDVDALRAAVREAPAGPRILRRFAERISS
jgi:GMP synthase (glutamine-hydrolysing)